MNGNLINGKNFAILFGCVITLSLPDLLTWPDRKDSIEHDWPEEDGIDKDLTDPHFKARQFVIKCQMSAINKLDFKTKFYNLRSEVSQPGNQTLYSEILDQTFHVYFVKMQNLKPMSRFGEANTINVSFELVFGETNPNDNIPDYLVDEDDNYIIG